MSAATKTGRTLLVLDDTTPNGGVWTHWHIDPSGKRPPLPLGAHPGNTGGKAKRSGAKTKRFKAICRHITNHPKLLARFEAILDVGDDKVLLSMTKTLAEFVHEKPKQTHEVTTSSLESLVDESQQAPAPSAADGAPTP